MPRQRVIWESRVEEIVLKVEHLYEVAWDRFNQSKRPRTIEPLKVEKLKQELRVQGVDAALIDRATREVAPAGEAGWLDYVRWCLDWLSRIAGMYAPENTEIDRGFGGKSLREVDEEVPRFLAERQR
jgi:hypothetical protein